MRETDSVAKTANWASQITEIDAWNIRTLARRMAATLAAMLGQIGLPGGDFGYGYGSSNGRGTPKMRMPSPKFTTGKNPVEAFIPVARVTDMLLNLLALIPTFIGFI